VAIVMTPMLPTSVPSWGTGNHPFSWPRTPHFIINPPVLTEVFDSQLE
jgi:hypothetical protein